MGARKNGPISLPSVMQHKKKAPSSFKTLSKLSVSTLIVNLGTSVVLLSVCILGCIILTFRLHSALNENGIGLSGQASGLEADLPQPQPQPQPQLHPHLSQTIHNNQNHNNSLGLSACLLVNDENPRLPEWLAYHYHVLPLRSLILAIDPASRSSPLPILRTFSQTLRDLRIDFWADEDAYMPPSQPRGACNANNTRQACLWTHRNRQQHFVMKCMETLKRRGKTWVLLLDVDEFIAFNTIEDDDPPSPLEEAPEGVATLKDWKVMHGRIRGRKRAQLFGLYEGEGTRNGTHIVTGAIRESDEKIVYGNVVRDDYGTRYFLHDDSTKYQDPKKVLSQAPEGIPTLKSIQVRGPKLYGVIYNDTYDNPKKMDGEYTHIQIHPKLKRELLKSGNIIQDSQGRKYFIENEQLLWPPHVNASQVLRARKELPAVSEGKTILDVIERYRHQFYFGSCLQIPRVLYGSKESNYQPMAPTGFNDKDFVTLRYRWHAQKGNFDVNKFQKTIIDVSRVPMDHLEGEQAYNIHRPLEYFCRADVPRFATSLFRVNHYLDSYEAYTYRNDARGNKRKGCMECYLKKGNGTDFAVNDNIRPWLRSFVDEVGEAKAHVLLAGVGDFRPLGEETLVDFMAEKGGKYVEV